MAKINIATELVREASRRLQQQTRQFGSVENNLSNLIRQVDGRIASRRNIGQRLEQAHRELQELKRIAGDLSPFIDWAMDRYEEAEHKIATMMPEDLKKGKKKSFWGSVGDGLVAAGKATWGFAQGLGDVVVDTVKGIGYMFAHPIETVKGIAYVATHPVESAKAIWTAIETSWNDEVVNGDSQSRGRFLGRVVGGITIGVAGTKGVDKLAKLSTTARLVPKPGGVRVVNNLNSPRTGVPNNSAIPRSRTPQNSLDMGRQHLTPNQRPASTNTKPARNEPDVPGVRKEATPKKDVGVEVSGNGTKWVDEAGNIKWPTNEGFAGTPKSQTLQPGTRIDRYGNETGSFVSPEGTPYGQRSLAPGTENKAYNVYEVVNPVEVKAGEIAPWFDQPGGGTQFKFDKSINELLDAGIIKKVER